MATLIFYMATAASQMAAQMAQINTGAAGANMFQPGQDPDKLFQNEAENLEVLERWCVLTGIENRLISYL
jgi:ER membrane protein complex subunit 3